MKQKLTLCLLLISMIGLAQAPDLINYQGIARDANGIAIPGNVNLKFDLHQGSAGAAIVFSEMQTVTTNSLGLFSTQIGKTSNLNSINWQSGSLFLEVSLSLSGGTYTSLGTQQLVSVPFSMLAKSVPATYSNNVLTVGSNAFTLTPSTGAVYTASTGIAITSGSIITNTAPDVPVTFTSASSNIAVNGTYPNFSISYTPSPSSTSLTLGGANNNSLSAGTNTVVLNTYTTGTGLVMSGGPNYTISSSASNPTIVGLGAAVVSPTTGNSFSVSVAHPTVSSSGNSITVTQGTFASTATIQTTPAATLSPGTNVTVSGTNPFTINAVPTLTLIGNNLSISGGNTVTIPGGSSSYTNGTGISITSGSIITNTSPDQVVTISNAGNIGITGSYPNFALSAPSSSFTQGGIVNVTTLTANSFSIGVPPPVFTSNGPSSITGTYPNLTINSSAGATYTSGTGISITSGSIITNTSPDQVVTISNAGNMGITGSYPNFALSAPSASFTSGGIVNIATLTANSYSIGVPNPTFTSNGPSSITGTYPNLTINSSPSTTYSGGTGISVSGTVITNTSPDQIVTISNAGNIGITGSYPNFALSAPSASLTPGGIVTISTITANSYSVSVPAPTLSIAGGNLSISGGNSVTLPVNSIAVTFSAAANPSVTATGNAYNINIPPAVAPNITVSSSLAAAGISTTSANNFNINVPSPNITVSQSVAAAVGISTTSANNYNINIPVANGAWGLTGNSGTTPGTNYIGTSDNTDLQFKTNNTFAMSINALGSVGIGTTSAASKLHVSNSGASAETGYFENTNSSGAGHALVVTSASGNQYALRTLNTNASLTSYAGIFEGGLIARGKNSSSTAFAFKAQEYGGSDLFVVRNDGSIGIRNNTPGFDLSIYNPGTSASMQFKNSSSASFGFIVGQNNVATNILSYEAIPMYFGNGGTNQMVLSSSGNLGIGNMSPAAKLDITGNTIHTGNVKIVDGTQGANKVLTSDAAGNASWQNTGVPPGAIMAYGGNTIPTGWTLCDGAAISRTLYPSLFTAIGTAWGIGDGSTTFNVPDMRGMFLRGVDGSANADPDKASRTGTNSGNTGNAVGSVQTDDYKGHTHGVGSVSGSLGVGATVLISGTGVNTGVSGGNETRPKNVYVYYIIKQ